MSVQKNKDQPEQVQSQSSQQVPNQRYTKLFTPTMMHIGLAHFSSVPIINRKKIKVLSPTIIKSLNKKTLTIATYYMYWKWECLFKCINRLDSQKLIVEESYYKNVMIDIGYPVWDKLTVLKLNMSNTDNIEALSWLNCHNLKTLFISVNVSSINKPLTKTMFKDLSFLEINSAKLCKIEISRIKMSQKDPLHICINNNDYRTSLIPQIQDLSYFSKIGQHFIYPSNHENRSLPTEQQSYIKIGQRMHTNIISNQQGETINQNDQSQSKRTVVQKIVVSLSKKFKLVQRQYQTFQSDDQEQQ